MKSKFILGIAAALAVAGLTALTITGCGQGGVSGSTSGGGNGAAMVVTAGDAPLSNILAARVTISSMSLTPSGGGSNVTILSQPRTIELSSLGAIQEPIETENVAAGTYTSVNVTVSSASVTYVDSTGAVVTGNATVNSPNDTVSLSPNLTVTQGQDVHLKLNFNLASSFDLSGSALTFTPSITSAAAAIENENESDREVEVTGSVVSVSSSSITVKSADTGVQTTFTINSSTQFGSNLTAGSIQTGSIVTVHGTIQSDGSFLATMISAPMDGSAFGNGDGGGIGVVTAVTMGSSNSVSSFTFVPQDVFGDMSSSTVTVSLSSATTYGLSEGAIANGITAGSFTNTEIFPGQSVEVIGPMTNSYIEAQEVDLAPESLAVALSGAVSGAAPDYTFTLALPAQSFLTTYDTLTSLSASTNAQTEYEDGLTSSSFASLASGTALEMHGYLLRDSSNNYSFTVSNVSQTETDN